MTSYKLGLTQAKIRTHHTVSLLILTLHTLVLGYLGLTASRLQYYLLAAAALNLLVLLVYLFFSGTRTKMRRAVTVTLVANGIMWFWLGSTLMAGLIAVMAVLQWLALKPPVVKIAEDGILYPGLPEKKYTWADLERVIIKDGILSIDLKDNSLLQASLDAPTVASLDVSAFNRWSATQAGK